MWSRNQHDLLNMWSWGKVDLSIFTGVVYYPWQRWTLGGEDTGGQTPLSSLPFSPLFCDKIQNLSFKEVGKSFSHRSWPLLFTCCIVHRFFRLVPIKQQGNTYQQATKQQLRISTSAVQRVTCSCAVLVLLCWKYNILVFFFSRFTFLLLFR